MSKEKDGSLKYIRIFFGIVVLLIIGGLLFRVFMEYKNRQFTQNVFNILIISDKYTGVIGLDKNENRLSSAVVTSDLANLKRENLMLQSINFGIPIHAYIKYESLNPQSPTRKFLHFKNLQSIFTNPSIEKKNISLFDYITLYVEGGAVDRDREIVKTYRTIADLNGLLTREDENFFRNSDLANRKTTLQIINGTSINGLGSRVAEMFSRSGFNVVSVLTQPEEDSKIIYSTNSKNDAEIIRKSFNFPLELGSEAGIASITLVIGEESELELENLTH